MSKANLVVKTFYDAFSRQDGNAMANCYGDNTVFSDPVFPDLHGQDAGNMWRMLCSRSRDLKITYAIVFEEGDDIKVKWDAHYTFGKTGRPVHNQVTATMHVADGKIVSHHDYFSFWRWSRQALGASGLILGWSPLLRNAVRKQAADSLKAWQ